MTNSMDFDGFQDSMDGILARRRQEYDEREGTTWTPADHLAMARLEIGMIDDQLHRLEEELYPSPPPKPTPPPNTPTKETP